MVDYLSIFSSSLLEEVAASARMHAGHLLDEAKTVLGFDWGCASLAGLAQEMTLANALHNFSRACTRTFALGWLRIGRDGMANTSYVTAQGPT